MLNREKCPFCNITTECEDFMEEHIFAHFNEMGIIEKLRCSLIDLKNKIEFYLLKVYYYLPNTYHRFKCKLNQRRFTKFSKRKNVTRTYPNISSFEEEPARGFMVCC